MDILSLVRNPDKVYTALKEIEIGDKTSIVANGNVKVVFPKYWVESDLGTMDTNVTVLAFVCFVVDDKYFSYIDAITKITLNAYDVSSVKIGDIDYLQLSYEKGETIADSITLVKDGNNSYLVFNEFMTRGRIPWYINYNGVLNAFDTSMLHAGFNTQSDKSVESMMSANRARDPDNPSLIFRHSVKTQEEFDTKVPVWLPLTSVEGTTSALARLGGNYMKEGITESVVSPTDQLNDSDSLVFL